MNSAIVEADGLGHNYGEQRALDGVSLSIAAGEIFGLLGPNGGGKTTLFRILATLIRPTRGSASIDGHDVVRDPHGVRRRLGVAFQSPSLDPLLTVRENLAHHGRLQGRTRGDLEARIDELLAAFDLADRAGARVGTLSGGLARRADLARALLHRPPVVLLDEPTTGLDPRARLDFWRHLDLLRTQQGTTVLVTTHLMEDAERCDRLVLLDRGQVVAQGTPDSLRHEIGGDVIVVRGGDPQTLADDIARTLGESASVVDGTCRIRRARGHEFVPALFEALPGRIEAVSVGRPTLEDVFIQRTGHHLWEDKESEST